MSRLKSIRRDGAAPDAAFCRALAGSKTNAAMQNADATKQTSHLSFCLHRIVSTHQHGHLHKYSIFIPVSNEPVARTGRIRGSQSRPFFSRTSRVRCFPSATPSAGCCALELQRTLRLRQRRETEVKIA